MSATLLAYAPLACPLGMAALMGIPALIYRAKRRHGGDHSNVSPEPGLLGSPLDFTPSPFDELTHVPSASRAAPRRDALAGSATGKS
jgi:hypothetical protein